MRSLLSIHIETRIGVAIIVFWAVVFMSVVGRAVSNFSSFLVLMEATTPLTKSTMRLERDRIDRWLAREDLNRYGDAQDTGYPGGMPMVDEFTGEDIDRYEYLMRKFPGEPWRNFTKYE